MTGEYNFNVISLFDFFLAQGKTIFDSGYSIIDQSFWTAGDSAVWLISSIFQFSLWDSEFTMRCIFLFCIFFDKTGKHVTCFSTCHTR